VVRDFHSEFLIDVGQVHLHPTPQRGKDWYEMGKIKGIKADISGPQKAMHSRVSYLYQAATYLATHEQHSMQEHVEKEVTEPTKDEGLSPSDNSRIISRHFVSDLRSITLKAQLRMSPDMKQSICKNCDTLLMEGSTCITTVENKSNGGKKPWADVLLRKCTICSKETRTPLASRRQERKPLRLSSNDSSRKQLAGHKEISQ
jgi:ribonuclease P protein subunit RPR2